MYSTHGYGILGDVMEEITGKTYKNLVKDYIGKPINAESFTVMHPFFDAPAGQVASTIEDIARFALGVMNDKYFPRDILQTNILNEHARINDEIIGLGWFVANPNQSNVAGYHAGSNGKPRAFLAIRPNQENAIALLGRNKLSNGAHDFGLLTIELMGILESD
jgi:CubicO group peptidase (beta-lactamase class C family)